MPGEVPQLPADAILVHIGPHKTGTSAIQSIAAESRAALQMHGVTYPETGPAHHVAAKALRQLKGGWSNDAEAAPDPSRWTRLAKTAVDTAGRVLLSSEFFAQADDAARAKLVRDLGAERVHLLVAARNPAAIAISAWQQVLRQGYAVSLESWLKVNFPRADEGTLRFWSYADTALLVSRWSEVVDPDRINVVILDEQDRGLLPRTFEQLLALPEGLLADVTPSDPNRGLTAAEAALLLAVLQTLDSRLDWTDYKRLMRSGMIVRLREVRRPGVDEPKPRLPAWAIDQAVEETDHIIEGLRTSGANLIGDLESLRGKQLIPDDGAPITDVPLDAAAEAVVGVVSAALFGNHLLAKSEPAPTPATTPEPKPGRRVKDVPTRELAGIVANRLRSGARRRVGKLRVSG